MRGCWPPQQTSPPKRAPRPSPGSTATRASLSQRMSLCARVPPSSQPISPPRSKRAPWPTFATGTAQPSWQTLPPGRPHSSPRTCVAPWRSPRPRPLATPTTTSPSLASPAPRASRRCPTCSAPCLTATRRTHVPASWAPSRPLTASSARRATTPRRSPRTSGVTSPTPARQALPTWIWRSRARPSSTTASWALTFPLPAS